MPGVPSDSAAWRPSPARIRPLLLLGLLAMLAILAAGTAVRGESAIPSPEQFFGFRMGATRRIAGWSRIVEYFRAVDRLSDRVVVQDLGPTTEGRPYLLAVVSAPDTIANLPRYQAMQRQLADARVTSAAEADRIAREGKAVVLIGGNIHGNEIGSSQMVNDLLYSLATSDAAQVKRVLENVIVLLVPSQNPDGQQMMADWHDQTVNTPYEDAPLPELYQRYAGHDNNRDSYMLTQVETRYLAQITYRDWLPEVYLDQHQMGSGRARIFVPPFKNPPNPNVDPLVWSEVNLLGQAMSVRLQEAGKVGVMWGEIYSGFWQGANSTNPWWHNMVALLTEVASARLAAPVFQHTAPGTAETAGSAKPEPGDMQIAPPPDLQFRMNYPQPWLGGRWTFADVVEHHRLAADGLLDAVAGHRESLKRNFYLMNRRTIERFTRGRPFAFIVPRAQHDPGSAAQLLRLVQGGGAEVDEARLPFTAGGVEYPAGTAVIRLAQPFGRWVKDLLEAQTYPDIRWPSPSAPIDRPYDMTAWTLGLLMGVSVVEVQDPFEAMLTRMGQDLSWPRGRVTGAGNTWVLSHEPNASVTATHRLLEAGAEVSWATEPVHAGERRFETGAIVVRRASPQLVATLAADLGLEIEATNRPLPAESLLPLHLPRVAIYEPWGGNPDAGWTRWVLEQHALPYTRVRHDEVKDPAFGRRFDVLILPDTPVPLLLRGLQGPNIMPRHRGGLGDEGVAALRAFVQGGGTIITLGNAAQFAIEHLGVLASNVIGTDDAEAFFCPGSLLRVEVETGHPIGFGMPRDAAAMFVSNGGYEVTQRAGTGIATVVRYPQGPLLLSGWIVGEARLRGAGAVLDVPMGRGRIILHTFRVQNRAQTLGTFKLLFNSILYGPAVAARQAPPTTQQQ
jgi:hypothetical protein